ncbi:MAG: pyridoxal phosphate-dependent aminotransferase [Bacteroidetes bacterium]|nr:pyridoxal phosphate-dependent aminotransferase [Bacteroidota bacterium]MCL5025929.1 pyridoxal phosphate-dependent aminotransferase [Chloroflexota bacterium]
MTIAHKTRTQMGAGSMIRKMFEEGIALKQRFGAESVFDLSLGNPVLEPPALLCEEMCRLVTEREPGMHRYMPNAGYPEARAAVAKQLSIETGLSFTLNEIVMTCGAGGGLNVVFKTILNPGEEVIVLSPYFVEYLYYIDNHGGDSRVVPTDASFLPDIAAIDRAISPRTRAIILNSPNNPTGVVYGADVLRQLGEMVQRKEKEFGTEIYLVSDEPYRKLIYDGLSYPFLFDFHPRSIAVTSHSKDLGLPGERIGYIAVHPQLEGRGELVDGLIFCNRILGFVNAPALMQRVVSRAQHMSVDIGEYQAKRDLIYREMTAMGYSMVKPQGAFYFFPKSPLEDDVAFCEMLLEWNVLVVPGKGFGTPGYFRLAYCVDDHTIEGALKGFAAVARRLKLPCSLP